VAASQFGLATACRFASLMFCSRRFH